MRSASDMLKSLLFLVPVTLLLCGNVWAQWDSCGAAVCEIAGERYNPTILEDGKGGAFIVWEDTRHIVPDSAGPPRLSWSSLQPSPEYDLYAQYIDLSGTVMWDPEGINISNAGYYQGDAHLVSDGEGGFIVAWDDRRDGYAVYAQRVDSAGSLMWDPDGVPISVSDGSRWGPRIVPDDRGGAIITWFDYRSDLGVYAQRVDPAGTPLWAANGIRVSDTLDIDTGPEIVPDGQGGAIVAWIQETTYLVYQVFAQKIDSSGTAGWDSCGVAVCEAAGDRYNPAILGDDKGGAFIVWEDTRHIVPFSAGPERQGSDPLPPNPEYDLYAQYIDVSGTLMWDPEGTNITNADYYQGDAHLVSDGEGGFIVAWDDRRAGYAIYAQRMDSTGSLLWDPDGVPVCISDGSRWGPRIVPDDQGGSIITWFDYRIDSGVYAQRIDPAGSPLWAANGIGISANVTIDTGPEIATDGQGGALITWIQSIVYPDRHVYAQKVDPLGRTGDQLMSVDPRHVNGANAVTLLAGPNPFRTMVTLTVAGGCEAPFRVSIFDVAGRLRRTLTGDLRIGGDRHVVWDARDDNGHPVAPGVYFCRLRMGRETAWHEVILLR